MAASTIRLKSDFAILDVKAGRAKLRAALAKGKKFTVVIAGAIDSVHSSDDGISQEFSLTVTSLQVRGF